RFSRDWSSDVCSSDLPTRKDIRSIYAGLRPLAAPKDGSESTKEISRDHKLIRSASGLITITGGKWTTYRKMAEDTVDLAIKSGKLPSAPCKDRKSTRLNSSHVKISYAVFCLKKKKKE